MVHKTAWGIVFRIARAKMSKLHKYHMYAYTVVVVVVVVVVERTKLQNTYMVCGWYRLQLVEVTIRDCHLRGNNLLINWIVTRYVMLQVCNIFLS